MTNSTFRPVHRALVSVSDKTGIAGFCHGLSALGIELVSTGGTAKLLREEGLNVADISDLTGFPEMMDGRVKTLHPFVHGGLLALRDNDEHLAAMSAHGIQPIDLLVVNLYPFESTVAAGADYDTVIENIDVGGPAMIRAAAKNHAHVGVVTDIEDYETVLTELKDHAGLGENLRRHLAATAYARTAAYDSAISTWFAELLDIKNPRRVTMSGTLRQTLRYGENPHQAAAFYSSGEARPGVATARQIQGKDLSYNNINDTDAAFELVAEFDGSTPTVAIIKHANPCGVAIAASVTKAYQLALRCDPVSAFGGIVALNQKLTAEAAEEITRIFTEVVIAPDAEEAAIEVFSAKKNLRLLLTDGLAVPDLSGNLLKAIAGGFLWQTKDTGNVTAKSLEVVSKRQPSERELSDMLFAFRVAKHVKSNAIVYVKDGATVGIGAGQMSRLDSSRIAARKSEEAADAAGLSVSLARGSVVASDAFFPFPDGLLAAAEAGATAVIQPGGSIRDDEIIAAADEAGLAMAFTGMRHFRH